MAHAHAGIAHRIAAGACGAPGQWQWRRQSGTNRSRTGHRRGGAARRSWVAGANSAWWVSQWPDRMHTHGTATVRALPGARPAATSCARLCWMLCSCRSMASSLLLSLRRSPSRDEKRRRISAPSAAPGARLVLGGPSAAPAPPRLPACVATAARAVDILLRGVGEAVVEQALLVRVRKVRRPRPRQQRHRRRTHARLSLEVRRRCSPPSRLPAPRGMQAQGALSTKPRAFDHDQMA